MSKPVARYQVFLFKGMTVELDFMLEKGWRYEIWSSSGDQLCGDGEYRATIAQAIKAAKTKIKTYLKNEASK